MRRSCRVAIGFSVFIGVLSAPVSFASAQVAPAVAEAHLEAGRRAIVERDYARAIDALSTAVSGGVGSAEAYHLLARAFLEKGRAKEARRAIGRARALENENVHYAVTELEILRRSLPPETAISVSDGRRKALAQFILEEDPENASALEELAIHHALTYRWYSNFDATKEPAGDGIRRKAMEEFASATELFHKSMLSDPNRVGVYAELLRLYIEEGQWSDAEAITDMSLLRRPNDYNVWLYRGLVDQLQNRSERAEESFRRAVELMPDDIRRAFLDTSLFRPVRAAGDLDLSEKPATHYWDDRDPLRLTAVNEREIDHYARMAYCQLWYGKGESAGWDTERGRIILRYGMPWSDATYLAGFSRINVLEYRDFEFVFRDATRGGHYTMYSPKASGGMDWTNDYVIQAAEMAISNPEQYDPRMVEHVPLLADASAFRGRSGAIDVYVHVLVGEDQHDAAVEKRHGKVGAFALEGDEGGVIRSVSSDLSARHAVLSPKGLQTTLSMSVPGGTSRVDVEYLADDRSGVGRESVTLDLPDFSSDSLSISDLLAASSIDEVDERSRTETGVIVRSGYAIRPMPWTELTGGSDLLIYFELYGVKLDATTTGRYRIDASLVQSGDSGGLKGLLSRIFTAGDDVRVATSTESSTRRADEARFISIGIPADIAGDHQLVLDVTDLSTGQRVTRMHDLMIAPGTH